jgi:hypothetical protein
MKKTLYPAMAFAAVFILHGAYSLWDAARISAQWVDIDQVPLFSRYLAQQDYFMGLSYGLAAAFTVYSFMRFSKGQQGGLTGAIGGVTMTGILYFGGCFLLGCCGSPMLAVYLSLFGSSYAGFTKPIVLIVTVVSIGISWLWMQRRSKAAKGLCSNNTVLMKMK